ncbi:hypothetical protein HYC85_017939 [Camellia sinensis]|uniref:Uncharacterized protein n=1 Tax=Camellia sinensis TaxID=4442 RepID=A0A7J7GSV7_CAMSI|nr:hypothetical protein HYC85_017939 [Camellia sinensis]
MLVLVKVAQFRSNRDDAQLQPIISPPSGLGFRRFLMDYASLTRATRRSTTSLNQSIEAPSSRSTGRRSKLHPVEDRRPPSIDRTVEDPKRLRRYPSSRPPNAFAELAAAYSGWHHFITTLSYVESKEPVIVTGAYVLSWVLALFVGYVGLISVIRGSLIIVIPFFLCLIILFVVFVFDCNPFFDRENVKFIYRNNYIPLIFLITLLILSSLVFIICSLRLFDQISFVLKKMNGKNKRLTEI